MTKHKTHTKKGFYIEEITDYKIIDLNLLLLADPSEDMIFRYLSDSCCLGAFEQSGLAGVIVILPLDQHRIEIKNIAVYEQYQRNGIGYQLMSTALKFAKEKSFRIAIIGTGDTSINQLSWYQKMGFQKTGVAKNFFVNNYQNPIIENGQRCRDMILLEKSLER